MENIISTVRIRPITPSSIDEIFCEPFEEKSVINTKTKEKFTFEHVYNGSDDNKCVFESLGADLIEQFLKGMNVCVFAYGQTSSGKTFTMKGNEENPGLIPQSMKRIFEKIESANEDLKFEVKCSYIEIYNESLIDLLDDQNKNLEIRENIQKGIHIPGLNEPVITSLEEAQQQFEKGEKARKFGETQANHNSSRSHTVFKIAIEIRSASNPDKITYSSLNLVDLAGSESISKSKAEGLRQREGANINKSLLALCNVISKLAVKEGSFINYRDSKLTRILQPFLGGNSKTAVICNINPLLSNYAETINTLKFGMSAGAIKNQVRINERFSYSADLTANNSNHGSARKESKSQIQSYSGYKKRLSMTNEYEELKLEMEKTKSTYTETVETQNAKIDQLQKEIEFLKKAKQQQDDQVTGYEDENSMLKGRLKTMEEENNKLRGDNDQLILILNDLESKVKEDDSEVNINAEQLEKALEELRKKLPEVERENSQLKEENKRFRADIEKLESIRVESNKEKNDLINHYKDHINHLKKVIESMHSEKENYYREKSKKDGIQFNNFNTQNIINVGVNNYNGNQEKKLAQEECCDSEFELKLLELETEYKTQIIQKNKQINGLNQKIVNLTKELTRKDEIINRYEARGFSNLSISAMSTPYKGDFIGTSANSATTNANTPVNLELGTLKKRKLGELNDIPKRIKNSPDRDELKKEVRYLFNRSKNYEKQLEKQRTKEEEYTIMISQLTKQNQDLEMKLSSDFKYQFQQ